MLLGRYEGFPVGKFLTALIDCADREDRATRIAQLEHTYQILRASPVIDRIFIAAGTSEDLRESGQLSRALKLGLIEFVSQQENFADSVYYAARRIPEAFPLIVTPAHNPFLSTGTLQHFCSYTRAEAADIYASVTGNEVLALENRFSVRLKGQTIWWAGLIACTHQRGVDAMQHAVANKIAHRGRINYLKLGIKIAALASVGHLSPESLMRRIFEIHRVSVQLVDMPWDARELLDSRRQTNPS